MPYLDHAATSFPKPEAVVTAMTRFLRSAAGNPGRGGHRLAAAAAAVVDEVRLRLAHFIGAPDATGLLFAASCTEAINLALKGLLRPGDHVVTDAGQHNALARPLFRLEAADETETRIAPPEPLPPVEPGEVRAALTPETRLLAFTHASNVTGVVQPVAEYGRIAREAGIPLLVDAAQSLGILDVDVQAAQIDLLAFPGHKGLQGPPGIGGLYVAPGLSPAPLVEGGTGTRSESTEQPATRPDRYESGTLNGPGICGLGAGLQALQAAGGPEAACCHTEALRRQLVEGLSSVPGIRLFDPPADVERVAVVSFLLAGLEPGEIETLLDQAFDIQVRGGLHCAPGTHRLLGTFPKGTVRVSPGPDNTPGDIDALLEALHRIAPA